MQEQDQKTQTEYDLFSPKFKADPFPTFAQMRRDAPIYAHNAPNGSTIWYITRYDDVAAVLRDDLNICKDRQNACLPNGPGPASRRSASHQAINENMLFADPPTHTRLRALVSKAFTPRRIAQSAGQIQRIADELILKVTEKGELELIKDYALPLPIFVISDLLGIPTEDRRQVASWSQAIISPGSRNLNYSARKKKVRALTDYMQSMFVDRRCDPRDDLVSDLVAAEDAGDRLSESELSSMVALLLVTGHETTVNLIGNGTLALLHNRDQLDLLQNDPSLWLAATEELLRYDGPVETSTSRWARHDFQLKGHLIKHGDLIRVVLASANRDGRKFKNADKLMINRDDNQHLAFGQGIHYCLGAPLARLEGQIALETLYRNFPNLKPKDPKAQIEWRSGVLFRGLRSLNLTLE